MMRLPVMLAAALMSVVTGRQAQITTSTSTGIVHPGETIKLTLEVELRPAVHVYAQGAEGYIPISWTLEDSPAYKAQEVQLPAAHKVHLDAIDETVPVYEGHFRLVRDITIDAAAPEGPLKIAGAFRYQACDDRMCYKPEKLPLQWTLTVARK